MRFEQINACTIKLTDGKGSLVPACHGYWQGYHTTRAIAWLMLIGNGYWQVRYKDRASRPMRLSKAKTYALEMVKRVRDGHVVDEPIAELNRLQAIVVGYGGSL